MSGVMKLASRLGGTDATGAEEATGGETNLSHDIKEANQTKRSARDLKPNAKYIFFYFAQNNAIYIASDWWPN